MATITIKIESEQLAREVLTQLGYLPGDDDVPDLISVDDVTELEEVRPAPKTHAEALAFSDDLMPKGTRKMPDSPKQGEFCTTEDPKEDVEPVENELGASLDVFSEETKKEREELYKQCMEVRKSLPSAEDRFKAQVDELWGCERLDYLDAMADHSDKKMREAVNAYVLREYTGHDLKTWPTLQKVLDDA